MNFFKALDINRFRQRKRGERPTFIAVLGNILMLLLAGGCMSLSRPLPAINLSEPGWNVRQGQAVWNLPGGKHDIAGDVTVANGPSGDSFVQFSKTPFPLVIGQTTSNRWQIEFPAENKRFGGPGLPSKRLMWLYLPKVLSGKAAPRGWTWTNSENNWQLENRANGERLDGFFVK